MKADHNVKWTLLLAMLATTASRSSADEKSWVGEKVMVKTSEVKFTDWQGDNLVEVKLTDALLPVLTEKEGFLRVRDDRREAWAEKKDMVLLRDAPGHYTDLIRVNEKDLWAWNMRGIAWGEKGELDNAIKDFTEAIRLDPKDGMAFGNRGNAWTRKKDYDKAIQDFDEVIRLNPKEAIAFNNRGFVWHAKNEDDKAIRDYDEAIRLNPNYEGAFNNRGNAWSRKKDYERAIQDYDEAIRLNPKYTLAFTNRGRVWRAKKEYDKAIRDYEEAIRLDPKNAWALFNRSVVQIMMREPEAPRGFQAVLDIEGYKGHMAPYAVVLGHFAARQSNDESAANRFLTESAGKLAEDWPYPAVRFLRGEIDEAALLKLATDDDKRTEARCFLGLDHMLKDRKNEALAHFRWVKEHGNPSFVEYTIAVAELDRLEQARDKSKQ